MTKIVLILSLLIIFSYGPVSAEFYKYTDANGVTRFTDDLSKVPRDQRPDAQSYEESESEPDAASARRPESRQAPSKQSKNRASGDAAQARALEKRRADLDREYQQIVEERNRLEKQRIDARTPKETKTFNRKIGDLNKRIQQWEANRRALNAELEAYNAGVARDSEREKGE